MSNPTTPFSWQMPTATDLVTDLPADFEVFGQAVATSMADLLGGTTGQILAKNSSTDMDFVWIANDQGDITGITATSPLTGGGTSGAVTVGIQSASTSQSGAVQLSDSTSTTSSVLAATSTAVKSAYDLAASAYAPAFTNNFYAGKNKIINGDFGVWQRGTSGFSAPGYTADRWRYAVGNGAAGVSQQTFTPGTAPASGYESAFYLRYALTSASTSGTPTLEQRIEDVRTFAGQTVTVSFWANASASASPSSVQLVQNFGSGGSASVTTTVVTSPSYTTSFVRYSYSIAVPSVSGKTIGTSSYLSLVFNWPLSTTFTSFDLWGVMVEAGSVVTPFQTATGSIDTELAACRRYLPAITSVSNYNALMGMSYATNSSIFIASFDTQARVAPTGITVSGTFNAVQQNTQTVVTPTFGDAGLNGACVLAGHTITSGAAARLQINGTILFTGCEL